MIKDLGNGRILVDNGPVQMMVYAEKNGAPMRKEAERAGDRVEGMLMSLVRALDTAKMPWPEAADAVKAAKAAGGPGLPGILGKMLKAAQLTGEPTMTPMCAVAGSFADLTADFLADSGATKVIINNGGDIALRLGPGGKVNLGVADRVGGKANYRLRITAGQKIGGVATSGLGGRSFTLGTADAVVVFAGTAAVADACATHIANTTAIESPAVTRQKARELDPATDIPELFVTTSIGRLSPEEIQRALDQGEARARCLMNQGVIKAAAIFVKGQCRLCPADLPLERLD